MGYTSRMALTSKQQRFVDEYLIDLNATQAAIRAGYSVATANKKASSWVGKGRVSEAIAAKQAAREKRTEVTQDMVVRGLLSEAQNKDEGSSHSARVSAWGLLGKHLGMFRDKVEHSGPDGGSIPHDHTGDVTFIGRIDQLAAAFARAADREETGTVPTDGTRKPVDPA